MFLNHVALMSFSILKTAIFLGPLVTALSLCGAAAAEDMPLNA